MRRTLVTQPALVAGFSMLAASLFAMSCSSPANCVADADCFQGEVCSAGTCAAPSTTGNNSASNNGNTNSAILTTPTNNVAVTNNGNNTNSSTTNAATNNTSSGNNGTNNNTTTTNSQTGGTNNTSDACVVDLFGNTCDEDEWEENDGYQAGTGGYGDQTPWESNSWCSADTMLTTQRTLSGTLCAGDAADAFRLVVANNGPMCITGPVTFRMTFDIKTPCPPALITVEPYTFGLDPVRNDLCAEDDRVRCRSENGGMTRIVEWVWDYQQIFDPRILISASEDDVQVEYDLTFEIIPQ